jgi:hypothetical protein
VETLRFLLDIGVDIDAEISERTWHIATLTWNRRTKLVNAMIMAGATLDDPSCGPLAKQDLLHIAVQQDLVDTVELLLACDHPVDASLRSDTAIDTQRARSYAMVPWHRFIVRCQ